MVTLLAAEKSNRKRYCSRKGKQDRPMEQDSIISYFSKPVSFWLVLEVRNTNTLPRASLKGQHLDTTKRQYTGPTPKEKAKSDLWPCCKAQETCEYLEYSSLNLVVVTDNLETTVLIKHM